MIIPKPKHSEGNNSKKTLVLGIIGFVSVILWMLVFLNFFLSGSVSNSLLETRGFQLIFIGVLPVIAIFLVVEVLRVNITLSHKVEELKTQFRSLQTDFDSIHLNSEIRIEHEKPSDNNSESLYEETTPNSEFPQETPQSSIEKDSLLQELDFGDVSVTPKTKTTLVENFNIDFPTLLKALNLPEHDDDVEGYKAFKIATKNELLNNVLTQSHAILHRFAEISIYMDNLITDVGPFTEWSQFAESKSTEPNPNLGGAGTQKNVAEITNWLSEDREIYNNAIEFYQKACELLFIIIPTINEMDIVDLANTRTMRAFLLLGRVLSGE